ncbi:hypothetical protein TVAGG3_0187200, partial [Trichomonas vaginalis G3]|uniref:hypothetical protein n=1 Tax=Trichomonas vaginalis (strain ATCC PRA-98 / G3) TaxID=412133 RepID=UPI0021E592AD
MQSHNKLTLKEAAYQSNRLMQRLLNKELPFEEAKSFFQNFLQNKLDSKLLSLHSRASIGVLFSQCLREYAPMIPLANQSNLDQMIYIMASALVCLGEPTSIDYNSALSILENLLQTNSFYLFSSETAIFALEVLSAIKTQES